MAKLRPVCLINAVLNFVEQLQTRAGNPRHDVPAVLPATLPDDELRLLEAIEQPRDVRHLSHQALRDFIPAQTFRFSTAQNSQDVVLRRGDPMRFESGLERVLQQRSRPLNAEVRFLLQAFERPRLFQLPLQLRRHTQILRVTTRIVKSFADAHLAHVFFSATTQARLRHATLTCFRNKSKEYRSVAVRVCHG
jgi:hypothetical protein